MASRIEQLRQSRDLHVASRNLAEYLGEQRGIQKQSAMPRAWLAGVEISEEVNTDINRLVTELPFGRYLRFITNGVDAVRKYTPLAKPTSDESGIKRVSEGTLIPTSPPIPPMNTLHIDHYLIEGSESPTLGTAYLGDRVRQAYVRLDDMARAIGDRATLRIVSL